MRPAFFFLLIASLSAEAASSDGTTSKGVAMRYGPILTLTVEAPPEGKTTSDRPARPTAPAPPPPDALARIVARKGLVIQLAENEEAYVCFDPDTLRMAAGWGNGFLDLSETNIGAFKGNRTGAGMIAGEILFQNADAPGWSGDEQFADPRPLKTGPLPRGEARFHGVYLVGKRVLLSYRVGDCEVVEAAELVKTPRGTAILRHLECAPSQTRRCMLLASLDPQGSAELRCLVRGSTLPRVADAGKQRYLDIPPHAEPLRFTVAIYRDTEAAPPADAQWDGSRNTLPSSAELAQWRVSKEKIRGGDARWPQTFVLRGEISTNAGAYVVDTIPLPEENPWKSWMRISALDFFPDGRAAVATLNGDVWLVSGIDERLEKVRWKRYAIGFYEPLGLKIVNGAIHVHGRDQITRLHDFDGDDEADFYECFNNDRTVYPSYHAYAYDLQTDRAGNFYYVVGGAWLGTERPWHAALFKLTPDGARSDIVATGFRAPNGMAIGPNDQITVSDNQGNWMPASKISVVRPGGFYGFVADPRVEPNAKGSPDFEAPLCWIPQAIDNSSGGQVWAPEGWGPFGGHLLHTSYGAAALFAVLIDAPADLRQGGVVKFPLKFDSGIMRGRFSPRDGQLYLVGLKGWQTAGVKDGCLQRVRYTGAPLHLPTGLRIEREAIVLSFAVPLEPRSAADAESFAIEQWNYRWSSAYGSPELSALRPGEPGRDGLAISKATLVGDRRSVRLHIPNLKPVMQMLIKMKLFAADGTPIDAQIANTIHRVPEGN